MSKSTTVIIDECVSRVSAALVNQPSGVIFEMEPIQNNGFNFFSDLYQYLSAVCKRHPNPFVVLGHLVILGHVRVEIVLSVEELDRAYFRF